jgi:hypothetical protein
LRTAEPIYGVERVFRGRGGVGHQTRPYHLYVLRAEGVDSLVVDGRRFVAYDERYFDPRGVGVLVRLLGFWSFCAAPGSGLGSQEEPHVVRIIGLFDADDCDELSDASKEVCDGGGLAVSLHPYAGRDRSS